VRIVGPGFELVRGWAEEGIPLSVVFRGIELKAERHQTGKATRPLRIEFCEGDVRAIYDHWRRAVGIPARPVANEAGDEAATGERKRPSLTKHLDRAIDRLARAAGRLDVPEGARAFVADRLDRLTAMREAGRRAKGPERDGLVAEAREIDRALGAAARGAAPPELLDALTREASRDLAAFRDRLAPDRWQQALDATVDRLLRDRWGLPTLDL
jgi:hypothetical protein